MIWIARMDTIVIITMILAKNAIVCHHAKSVVERNDSETTGIIL
jgi:hypothetical protein